MKYPIIIVVACLALTGCYRPPNINAKHTYSDMDKRHEYFMECLKNLPLGPEKTHYNDWDEVIDSCGTAAYATSFVTADEVEAAKHPDWILAFD